MTERTVEVGKNSRKFFTGALLVRMSETEHAFLKEESEVFGVSMSRILVYSFLHWERPTREVVRQREEAIFILRRIRLDLRAIREELAELYGYDVRMINEAMTELTAALGELGHAFCQQD